MNSKSTDLSTLRQWLLEAEFTSILELVRSKKRVLSLLTALTYDADPEISNRAIQVSGLAAAVIAERDPEYVRNYLLRLFWLLNDESGGICWKAPELIGEILYNCPQFEQFVPMVLSLQDLENEDSAQFQAGVMWAIARIAK